MRKKLFFLSALAMLFCLASHVSAQVSVLTEDFENGMPSGWTVDPATVATPWTVSSSGLQGVTAHGGTNYLSLSTTNQQPATKLVLPIQDMSLLTQPEMTFYLMQKARGQNTGYARDTLKVYVRTSATANWTLVQTFSSEITSWAKQTIDLSALGAGNLQFAFEYVYGAGLGLGIDDLRIGDASVCYTPHSLQAYRVTHNSAELMWTAYETAFEYGLKVSTTPLTNPGQTTANVFDQNVYFKPYAVTGLNPSTTYYFYVSANCGAGDESSWSNAGTFTTQCAPVTLPYNQGFEASGDFTSCWTKNFNSFGDWTSTPSASTYAPKTASGAYTHSGTYALQLYGYYYYYSYDQEERYTSAWAASPEINATNLATKQVSFWAYATSLSGKLHVGMMSDVNDLASFVEIAEIQCSAVNTYEEFILPLNTVASTNARHLAFFVDGYDNVAAQASFYFYIDDIVFEDVPVCPKASLVKAENVTGNSARITWLGGAPAWNIKVSSTSLTDPATGTGDVLDTQITGSPYTVTGLSPKTTYYVYLQPNCTSAGNGLGPWSTEIHFTTTQVPALAPYFCDFEGVEGTQWDIVGTGNNQWAVGTAANNGGVNGLYISNDNGTTNYYGANSSTSTAYRTIQFAPGIYNVEFDWRCVGETNYDWLTAYLVPTSFQITASGSYTSAQNGWIPLNPQTVMVQNSAWLHSSDQITITDTTTYNLVFNWHNDGSVQNQTPAAVDNVSITSYTCAAPSNLAVVAGSITQNVFSVQWQTSPLGETTWELEVLSGTTSLLDTLVSTTTYTVSGLTPSTTYTVRVRSVCGASDLSAWTTINVTTACGDVTALPFTETFSAYGTGSTAFPPCWTTTAVAGGLSDVFIFGDNDITGDGVGCLYINGSDAYTPNFNVPGKPLNTLMVEFAAAAVNAVPVYVGICTDLNNKATSSVFIDTITTTPGYYEDFTVPFSRFNGTSGYIFFMTPGEIFIDDVRIVEQPSCLHITDLHLVDTGSDFVSIAWEGDATAWELVYGPQGFDPDSATMTPIAVTTKSYILTGLTPSTIYDIYVRQNCGAGDVSEWRGIRTTTTAVPGMVPYTCGFEASESEANAWTLLDDGGANHFVVGTGAHHTGSRALYISQDGTTSGYNTSSSSLAWATRTIVLPAGVYDISFSWRGVGEGTTYIYDYGRAFLAPKGVDVTQATFGSATTPDGWTALDQSWLNQQSTWQTVTTRVFKTVQDTVQMVFFWKNDGSAGAAPALEIDDITITPLTGCLEPAPITASNQNGATVLNWVSSAGATYEVKVSENALTDPSTATATIDTTVNAATITLSGLAAMTTYHVYVRSICSATDISNWSHATFTTPCAAVRTINESFEGTGIPMCWDAGYTGGGSVPSINANTSYNIYSHSGNQSIRFNGSGTSWLVTPPINVNIAEIQVSFWLQQESAASSGLFKVGVMTDPNDYSTFTPAETVNVLVEDQTDQHTVNFSSLNIQGTGYRIAFVQEATSNYWYWLDDVEIGEYRMCQMPQGVAATNLTTTGATVSWNSPNGLTHTMVVATASIDPATADENDPNVLFIQDQLTDNYLDLSGVLSPATTYYVYVQSDCNTSDGKLSLWSDEYVFTTLCYGVNVPVVENFDQNGVGVGSMASCWTTVVGSNGTLPTAGNTYEPYITSGLQTTDGDGKALRIYGYYSAGTTAADSKAAAVMPQLNSSLDALMLSFAHRSETGSRKMLVGLMSDPSDLSTFTPIDTAFSTSAWQRQTVKLSGYNYGSYIGFLVDGDLNQASTTIYLDSVVVDSVLTCYTPLNVRALNITGSTVDVDLQTLSAADSQVQIQIASTLATDEASINALDFVVDTIVNVANLPVTLGGLQPLTGYYLYARVACPGNTFSPRADAVSFNTACGVFAVPFAESFDESAMPNCWSVYGATPSISSTQKVSGKSLYLSSASVVELPNLDLQGGITGYELSFAYRATSTAGTVEAGVLTAPHDTASFVSMGVINPATASTWNNFSANFTTYTGTGNTIAFRVAGTSFYIDDVYVGPYTSCARPTGLTASNVDTTSFTMGWTAGASETNWEVAIVPAGGDVNNATPVAVTTNSYNFTGLVPATRYDVYVRSVCGAADFSAWSKATVRTAVVAQGLPFTSNFEDSGDNGSWEILNIQGGNQWVVGSATGNGGTSLYVSNDAGTSNDYTISDASLSIARRLFRIESDVLYSYDWKNTGESLYDYIRAYLAPESFDFSTFTDYSTFSSTATSAPTGWIILDNGQMVSQSTWQTANGSAPILTTGNYYLVFVWRNDGSMGTSPAGAIDNVELAYPECYAENVRATAAATSLTINASTDCQTVELKFHNTNFSPAGATGLMLDTVVSLPFTVTGLNPQTSYYAAVRGFCASGDTTAWSSVATFKTLCASVTVDDNNDYTCGFESYTNYTTTSGSTYAIADCWSRGTNYNTTTPYPYTSTSYHHDGSRSLYFYAPSTGDYTYAASPEIIGSNLNELQVDFWLYSTYTSSSIEVGVMSDPEDINTFVSIGTAALQSTSTWTKFNFSLANAPANAHHVAFRAQLASGDTYCYLDEVKVWKMPACAAPSVTVAPVNNCTALGITIGQNTSTRLPMEVVAQTSAVLDTTTAFYHATVNVDTITVPGITPLSTYYVFARALCSPDPSDWTMATINVPAPADTIPMSATFENSADDAKWHFADNGTGSSRWMIGSDPNACNGGQRALYVSSNNSTCTYTSSSSVAIAYRTIDVPNGTFLVNYDWKCHGEGSYDYMHVFLAPTSVSLSTLTSFTGTSGAPAGCIALDGGQKLNLQDNWQTYSQMHTVPAGQYHLVFHWRDDSSVSNDPPASVDNVFFGTLKYATITDSVCSGYNYMSNGFNIPSDSISITGPNSFQRLQNDTMLTLNLIVVPSAETVFNETICSGTTYTQNGFNTGTAGTYHRYLTSAFGCDSIVTLNLTVTQGFRDVQSMTICQSQTPYIWNGQSLSTTGQYTHTVSSPDGCDSIFVLNLIVTQAITTTLNEAICQGQSYTFNGTSYNTTGTYTWNGTAANGCDSIVTLHLTVNPTYNQNASLTIEETELPYTWNGIVINAEGIYTWNGTTAAGCDSIIVLDLRVKGVGIDYAEDGMFAISPNPVQRGGNVRLDVTLSEAEREGLVVEVFTSNGKLVDRFEPKEQPMYAKMPDADGLYMIRLTTGTGRVLYGKVIVK